MELLADRFLVEDADDRVLAVHARHDRDAEVDRLPRQAQLEASVLRHALLGDVELGHDLDARDDRAVEAAVDRPHRRLQHAVDAVLHVHRVVAGLDVNVARPALNRGVDGRVDQPDDGAGIGRQLVDGQLLVAGFVFAQQLQLEALGRLLEHARRALALLEDRLNRRRRADRDLDVRAEQHRQLVDHRQVGRIRHDDHERVAVAVRGHEPVAQHQVGGNRPEEVVVEVVVRQVDKLQPIAFRQPLGDRGLGRALRRARFRHADIELALGGGAVDSRRRFAVHADSLTPLTRFPVTAARSTG